MRRYDKMDDMAHCGQFRQQGKQPLPIPSRGWKKWRMGWRVEFSRLLIEKESLRTYFLAPSSSQ